MTYGSEELWEALPHPGAGLPPVSAFIESSFLHPDDLAAYDADLAERRSRPPIGFGPKEIRSE